MAAYLVVYVGDTGPVIAPDESVVVKIHPVAARGLVVLPVPEILDGDSPPVLHGQTVCYQRIDGDDESIRAAMVDALTNNMTAVICLLGAAAVDRFSTEAMTRWGRLFCEALCPLRVANVLVDGVPNGARVWQSSRHTDEWFEIVHDRAILFDGFSQLTFSALPLADGACGAAVQTVQILTSGTADLTSIDANRALTGSSRSGLERHYGDRPCACVYGRRPTTRGHNNFESR